MTNNNSLFEVVEIVKATDFFEAAHGEIFSLARDQIEAGRGAGAITLMHDMAQDADIGGISASEYLAVLERESPDSPSVGRRLAMTIRDLSIRRQAIEAAEQLAIDMRDAPASTTGAELRARYDAIFETMFASAADLGIRSLGDYAGDVLRRVGDSLKADTTIGLGVGLAMLQDLIGRLMPGRLYVVAGTPGAGKSALAAQIARHLASGSQDQPAKDVVLFEIEMQGEELAERAIAQDTNISADRIERAAVRPQDYDAIAASVAGLKRMRLWVDQAAEPPLSLIRARAIRMQRLHGLDVLIIDHLLHIKPPERMDAVAAVRPNLMGLKTLAKDLGIPVVVLTQYKAEYSQGGWLQIRRPHNGDLFGGSVNEQVADVVLHIYREEPMLQAREPHKDDPKRADYDTRLAASLGKAEFILTKRRGGRGFGTRTVGWVGARSLFTDNVQDAQNQAWAAHEAKTNRSIKQMPAALFDEPESYGLAPEVRR